MAENARLAVYATLATLGAILVFYGAIDQQALPLWLDLADQVLTTGALVLAMLNVRNRGNDQVPDSAQRSTPRRVE